MRWKGIVLGVHLKADEVLFRFRYAVHVAIYVLGFIAPWDRWVRFGGDERTWLALAAGMARSGWLSFSGATVAVLVVGILCASAGAWLRTWGTAYLGGGVVQDAGMQGARMVADGPYRHLRNPLYLGTWMHTFAVAMLMPLSGAVFSIVAIGILQLLLIRGEEKFLGAKLGAPYVEYRALVPRLVPTIRAPLPSALALSGMRARWPQAVLAEIYMWGVAASFAVLGWQYNVHLLTRCVLVWLGVSLVARAFPVRERAIA